MLTPIPRKEIEDRIKEIANDKKAPLTVSKKLNSPHIITSNTKNWFESSEKSYNRKSGQEFIFHLSIDKRHLNRSLLIIDSLVKLLEYRGHTFKKNNDNQCVFLVEGREINMSMRNVGKYQEENHGTYKSKDVVMTDSLCIQMFEDSWNRKEWKDTPNSSLEEKLCRVVAYTELYAEYSHHYHLELKEGWRQQEIERQKEIEKSEEIEQQRKEVEKLILTAENFDKAKKIEIYLSERKSFLIENNLFTKKEEDYFEWGMKQFLELNPLMKIGNL